MTVRQITIALVFYMAIGTCSAQVIKGSDKDRNHRGWNKFSPSLDYFARVKAGYGMGYGILGVNGELGYEYGSFYMGVGYGMMRYVTDQLAFNIGFHGYIFPTTKRLRIRGSAGYGVNNIYMQDKQSYVAIGYNLGVGMEHRLGDHFIYDMDLYVPLNNTNNHHPRNPELEIPAYPSIGFGIAF